MPHEELCSPCYTTLHIMMQSSPYSVYHDPFQSDYLKARLEYIYRQCDISGRSSNVADPQYIPIEEDPMPCFTGVTYTTKEGDTCDSIALEYSTGSAMLQSANAVKIANCTKSKPGVELCIPLSCEKTYILQDEDTCDSIELHAGISASEACVYITPGSLLLRQPPLDGVGPRARSLSIATGRSIHAFQTYPGGKRRAA
ncbi:hypothetical protein BJX65DRAFT_276580 [Aspergillus insuetus]